MMRTTKGPGIFLAQFIGQRPPFDSLAGLAEWAAELGYDGLQVPTADRRILDLDKAATSLAYCDEIKGMLADHELVISELSVSRQGHLLAQHPAYEPAIEHWLPQAARGSAAAREAWAKDQIVKAALAARNLGVTTCTAMTGGLLWPFVYPFPPRAERLVEEAFAELGRRWRPILDAFEAVGVDLCFEPHPGEDVHDGATFERFLEAVGGHRRAKLLYDPSHLFLQHMDYLGFLDLYRERIGAFHVKDAEFERSARTGSYGGYLPWAERAGRFRSAGDGQIHFGAIFSRLAQMGYDGWAVLEWECCIKHPLEGAAEGADFIRSNIIRVAEQAFDAPMRAASDPARNRRLLGLG